MTAVTMDKVSHPEGTTYKKSFMLLATAILALTVGFGSVAGGIFGAFYTWNQATVQNVVTPDDAATPETAVRSPPPLFSMLRHCVPIFDSRPHALPGGYPTRNYQPCEPGLSWHWLSP